MCPASFLLKKDKTTFLRQTTQRQNRTDTGASLKQPDPHVAGLALPVDHSDLGNEDNSEARRD